MVLKKKRMCGRHYKYAFSSLPNFLESDVPCSSWFGENRFKIIETSFFFDCTVVMLVVLSFHGECDDGSEQNLMERSEVALHGEPSTGRGLNNHGIGGDHKRI